MNRLYLTLILCLLFPLSMLSQVHPDSLVYKNVTWEMLEGRFYHLDVNGVSIDDTLSQKEFIALFGEPDQIFDKGDGGAGYEMGFKYARNGFETTDGVFNAFFIYDPCYKVMTRYFDGGVKVGDHISIFKGFQDGVLYQLDPKEWGKHSYKLLNGSDGCYLRFFTDDKGYVVYMFYIEPL